ncbi:MAG TPA: glutathione S-transferase family protein [Rhodospirillales bacterium]|nr:glutathione S-transferase family protein [Rhodospirillales bacterium]
MTYELYWISGSPNAWRAKFTLEYKGLSYVSHRLDPGKKEHKTPEMMALNPRGKVPVLKDGDVVIYESIAIMAYLESKHPQPPLFGDSPQATGQIWQRLFEVMNYVREPIEDGVVRPLIRGQADQNGDQIKAAATDVHQAMNWLESLLTEAPYLAGDTPTAVDICTMPIIQGLIRAGRGADAVKLNLGLDGFKETYGNVDAWLVRIEGLPGYENAYPPHWREP